MKHQLLTDAAFWVTSGIGSIVKLLLSERMGLLQSTATVLSAIYAAYVLTDPTLKWLNLPREDYLIPVVALWTLIGEGLVRYIMRISKDGGIFQRILDKWVSK